MKKLRLFVYPALLAVLTAFSWMKALGTAGTDEIRFSAFIQKAQTNEQKQAYITAAECYAAAAEIRPDDEDVLIHAAENYLRCDEGRLFLRYCRRAADLRSGNDSPWLLMCGYYLDTGDAAKARELLECIPEKCRSEKTEDMMSEITGRFQTGYKGYSDAGPFYGEYFAACDGKKWGLADEDGRFYILPEYDAVGAYNADEDILPVCSDGVWCFINESGQVRSVPSEKYTWLGAYSSGLAPFCCDGKYGYTDTDYNERPERYDYAGSFSENVAAVKKDGKWALVSPELKCITGFEYDEIITDEYGFCVHSGLVRALKNGREVIIGTDGRVSEYGKIYSCGLSPVAFGDSWGYEDENGNVVIDAYFDEVSDFSENGRAVVKEDDRWRVITLEVYR